MLDFLLKQGRNLQAAWPIYTRLLSLSMRYWPFFLMGTLSAILGGALDGLIVWLLKPIIDQGFVHRNATFIHWLPIMIITLGFFRGVFACGTKYCITRTGRSVVFTMRRALFEHLLRLPMPFFEKESAGRMLSMFTHNIDQLGFTATNTITTGIREVAVLIGALTVMFSLNWQLSLIFLFVVPPMMMVVRYAGRRLRKLNTLQQITMADANHIMEEGITGMPLIRSHGAQEHEQEKFLQTMMRKFRGELKVAVTDAFSVFAVQFMMMLPLALTLYLTTASIWHISAGTFTALISAMLTLRMPVQRLATLNAQIQSGLAAAESVFDVLDLPAEEDLGQQTVYRCQGELAFKDISFTYPHAESPAIDHLHLNIKPGETVALVGLSGGGKSTLVKLLQRYYPLQSGCIKLDGTDITEYPLSTLRNQIAVVSQDTTLFSASVRYNIAYGCPDASDEAIISAAKVAHAWEFIQQLPDGLDTLIGPKGTRLSGGQKQRIAIARAVMTQRPILLLDEATSALDTQSEKSVQQAMEQLLVGVTAIVIAHRLSTIQNADRILVIDQGRIAEQGSHHDLLSKNGLYSKLHQLHQPPKDES